ncbi:hypothetical protein HPP92_014296 [Vanilla planifolia]|uniref:non-specific serine/threonine protein kinase n=1 Tax=Vanilla planifolia TaxID=51239 RepID=A0A835QQ02_VANPL|nr:hypothetical protein HPP92_014296 [Vanilla planifolia]
MQKEMDWAGGGRWRCQYFSVTGKTLVLFFLLWVQNSLSTANRFIFHGFDGSGLRLNGGGTIEPNGLLRLTNFTKYEFGHAFFPSPLPFLNSSTGEALSFSTSFVFAIVPRYHDISSHGIAFAITPTANLTGVLPSQHLGLFNHTNNGDPRNHILAVELDTIQNKEFSDINDNHVGIDVNGLRSVSSAPTSFFLNSPNFQHENLSLISGQPMRVWVEFDGKSMKLNVTIAPLSVPKPQIPLLSSKINLSSIVLGEMYAGFSASTGAAAGLHYILGWSFSMDGSAEELKLSNLPSLPPKEAEENSGKKTKIWVIVLPIAISVFLLISASGFALLMKTKKMFEEVVEDWETEYGPHRISHDSRQGMKEFVAEIASIGRLRHRNLVQLLGYCRRRGELLLIYDFMPNGSLDNYIFCRKEESLSWSLRFKVIRGIAAGLLYLHEEWEQVVVHRDIKASNVLLDAEFNGKLGDFGLARLYDRGSNPQTTRVVGTLGYLAPELSRTGKSTTRSDVFGFGAFLLEVASGKKPIELKTSGIEMVLVDWVFDFLKKGAILEARDRKLGDEYAADEVEMVLKLGLMCSQHSPEARPSMRQVLQCLEGEAPLPEMSVNDFDLLDSSHRMNRFVVVDGTSSNSGTVPAYPSSSSSSESQSFKRP